MTQMPWSSNYLFSELEIKAVTGDEYRSTINAANIGNPGYWNTRSFLQRLAVKLCPDAWSVRSDLARPHGETHRRPTWCR